MPISPCLSFSISLKHTTLTNCLHHLSMESPPLPRAPGPAGADCTRPGVTRPCWLRVLPRDTAASAATASGGGGGGGADAGCGGADAGCGGCSPSDARCADAVSLTPPARPGPSTSGDSDLAADAGRDDSD
jgi:hypothetical protein